MEVAKAKGLPLLKHHLLPRTKGFTLLAETVAGKSRYKLIRICIEIIFLNCILFH